MKGNITALGLKQVGPDEMREITRIAASMSELICTSFDQTDENVTALLLTTIALMQASNLSVDQFCAAARIYWPLVGYMHMGDAREA